MLKTSSIAIVWTMGFLPFVAADARGDFARCEAPPATPGDNSKHREEMLALRQWWYQGERELPSEIADDLAHWVADNPKDAEATFYLGVAHAYGLPGLERTDHKEAMRLLKTSAGLGFVPAQAHLGKLIIREHDPNRRDEGLRLLKEAVAQNDSDGLIWMSELTLDGELDGVLNVDAVRRELRKALELGNVRAHSLLAHCYEQEDASAKAVEELQAGEAAGDRESILELANAKRTGTGTEQDLEAAFALMRRAALMGSSVAMAEFGDMNRSGEGTESDLRRAFQWYESAARAESGHGMQMLANAYLTGEGTKMNVSEGMKILQQSAQRGDSNAECMLGRAYLEGLWVDRDLKKAREMFQSAADRGSSQGATYLKYMDMREQKPSAQPAQ
ncbi:MAG TPA: tetratricopeptide repeat protein [Tepidisphaeraceae bacterium]|jgi:hypothetical protein|nr:tetratricopeptide repeat protein [Tepidisphaeraceae bacterium]